MESSIPAPTLTEVAQIWWDVDRVPHVIWDRAGRRFDLIDPEVPAHRLHLTTLDRLDGDPASMARVLAEGLAACDFPPTGTGAATDRVAATLRAAGRDERPV